MHKIFSWNADGLTQAEKIYELHRFILFHQINILLLQETHLKNHNYETLNISGYTLYHTARTDGSKGGTGILIKTNIDHCNVTPPPLQNLEITAIKISTPSSGEVIVCSAYNSPSASKKLRANDITTLLHWAGKTKIIIAGDLNSKHPDWHCRVANPNGTVLKNLQERTDFHIWATEEPTHHPKNRMLLPDVLDIAITRNINTDIQIKVLCALESDHNPISITVGNSRCPRDGYKKYAINPVKYQAYLREPKITPKLDTTEGIEAAVCDLTSIIQTAKIISREEITLEVESATSHLIKELIKEKNQTRKRYQRSRDPEEKRLLNRNTRQLRKLIQKGVNEKMKEKLSAIKPGDHGLYRETLKLLNKPQPNPPIERADGSTTYKSNEKSEIIAEYLEKIFTPAPRNPTDTEIEYECCLTLTDPPEPLETISPEEMEKAIKKLKPNKAPGHDHITNEDIKLMPPNLRLQLLAIYNACFILHYFPMQWKIAKIITFVKPGKTGTRPEQHRPISLLSCLGKLLEQLIHAQLQPEVDKKLRAEQFGFRPGHSTVHALNVIAEQIISGFNNQCSTGLVTLDAEKAFDKTWHPGIIFKLSRDPGLRKFTYIINSFLTGRKFYVQTNKHKSTLRPILASVAQGSTLSPTIYNLATSDAPIIPGVKRSIYADDFSYMCTHPNPKVIHDKLSEVLALHAEWQEKWKMSSNASKSKAILFSRKRQNPTLEPLPFNGQPIQWTNEVKVLGVTLDKKLNWKSHTNETLIRANRRKGLLFNLIKPSSGLSLDSKRLIYISLLRPIINYAIPVWGNISNEAISKLQVFQNKVLRLMTGAPWFVRNSIIASDMRIETFLAHMKELAEAFYSSAATSENPLIQALGTTVTNGPYNLPAFLLSRQ